MAANKAGNAIEIRWRKLAHSGKFAATRFSVDLLAIFTLHVTVWD
jgi:hypothetical protein